MADCFYEPLDDDGRRWRSTEHTSGPWDPRAQHGGPPAALLGRAMERCAPREEMAFGRVTCEILRPVPIGELEVTVRVVRPGRSVELVEAVLSAGGREVVRASGWRVRRTTARAAPPPDVPAPLPDSAVDLAGTSWTGGYLAAVEWRVVRGSFTGPGPAVAWTRLRHPLVPGEQPSPLQRVLAVADSGNGLSSELDLSQWHFINPELTVHLHREPAGEWVCLDAATVISPGGVGLATSVLSDRDGRVAVGAQSLLVARRDT